MDQHDARGRDGDLGRRRRRGHQPDRRAVPHADVGRQRGGPLSPIEKLRRSANEQSQSVSTKYKDRDRNYQKICATIERITALKHANYLLFFPSFDFLEQISSRLSAPGFKPLIQKRSMTTQEIDAYLEELRNSEGNLLFAVQGGVFSEGVDFRGSMASGAFIVGPGLPSYDLERELLREYYEKEYGNGFDYAYTYPAMTKVIQSAGRVVRSPSDCGLIVLLDGRFLIPSYAQSMPIDWYNESPSELVSTSILDDVSKFWQGHSGATN